MQYPKAKHISPHRIAPRRFWGWIFALVWVVLAVGCGLKSPSAAGKETLEIVDQARTRPMSAAADAAPQPVQLPQAWNRLGLSGKHRYWADFDVPASALESGWGIYIPRAGNRFHVWVNGHQVAHFGDLKDTHYDYAQQPSLVIMPPQVLVSGRNQLRVDIAGERARFAGLSQLWLGPPDVVSGHYWWRETLLTKGSFVMFFLTLLIGLITLGLGIRQKNGGLLLLSAACLLNALHASYAISTYSPLPFTWWSLVTDIGFTGFVECVAAFALIFTGLNRRWALFIMVALAVLTCVTLPIFAFEREIAARQIWLQGMVVSSVLLCALLVWQAWRSRRSDAIAMAAASVAGVALGVYDHLLVFHAKDGYAGFTLVRFSPLFFLTAMTWMVFDRYQRQRAQIRLQESRLHDELQNQKIRLEQAFDHQQAVVRSQVQSSERTRILSDIHDGLGLQLQALLAEVESGDLQRANLSHEVRTTIEQMRLLVSNTEQFDGDVLMLLGQIKHQIGRRLKAAHIELDWVNELPADALKLTDEQGIALQRLMFELTTNVIRHSGAKQMQVLWKVDASGCVVLTVRDDGVGFDRQTVMMGTGLKSIQRRAQDLAANVSYRESVDGRGTYFEMSMPPP